MKCLVCQHRDISETEKQLNVDNKLSIHFGEDKTKSILFASKFKNKNI